MNTTILAILIVYCVGMMAVGIYFSKKDLEQSDFLLGGKKIPGWALAFSERSTCESVWLLMGATGFVYSTGLSSIWIFVGSFLGVGGAWVFFSKRFMQETNKYNVLTLSDYLAVRFGDNGKAIRWLASITIVCFFMFYLAAQFAGAGKTLLTTFGLNQYTGMVLSAVIVIIYATMGGFLSVVWTDVIQSLLMVLTLIGLPIVAFFKINAQGLSVTHALATAGAGMNSWTGGLSGFAVVTLLVANFSWFFSFLGGQPQLSARFMAMKDEKEVTQGRNIGLIWTVFAYSGVFLIGLTAIALYGPNAFADAETLLPFMIQDLLPPWLAGLLLSGILAAMMSTSDSVLLVITGSISEDIINKAMGVKLNAKQLMKVSRLTVVGAGLLGLIIGMTSKSLIYYVINWFSAGIGCTFSVAVCLAFFWKKTSGKGIVATLASGFIITVIWMSSPLEAVLTSRVVTFFLAGIIGMVVSVLFPDKEQELSVKETEPAI